MAFLKFMRRWASLLVVFFCLTTMAIADLEDDWDKFEDEVVDSFDDAIEIFEKAVAHSVADLVENKRGVLAQFSMGYSEKPPVSAALKKSKVSSGVTIGLYDEDGDYPQPKDFDFLQSEYHYDGWDQSWFGIALDSFDTVFELDIDLNAEASASGGNLTLSLLKLPVSWEGVTVEVDFQACLTAAASMSMSFVAGLELSMPKPAAIVMPAFDPVLSLDQSKAYGFKPEDFVLKPIFNASIPKLEFDLTISLRTVFSISAESLDVGSIWLDLPAFDFNVKTLTNKLSNCKHPLANTPSDQIYAELIHMTGNLDAILSYELLGGDATEIERWTLFTALDECYAFLPGVGSIGPVPASSKDKSLTAAAVTTCTIEGKTTLEAAVKSLSTAEKAGIALGVIGGACLIAVLAWFGGRASHRRSMKKDALATVPVREMQDERGFYAPGLQAPQADGRWRRLKNLSFSSAESPLRAEYGESMRGSGDLSDGTALRSTEYEGHRLQPVEGQGLLRRDDGFWPPA